MKNIVVNLFFTILGAFPALLLYYLFKGKIKVKEVGLVSMSNNPIIFWILVIMFGCLSYLILNFAYLGWSGTVHV